MAEKLFMTALSPTMERGTITEWHKKEGETVKSGDIICEVETDKAVMEYEADFDAVILKIIVTQGQAAAVGETIAVYGQEGEDYEDLIPENIASVDVPAKAPVAKAPVEKAPVAKEEPPVEKMQPIVQEQRPAVGRRVKASPLARKMAEVLGVELSKISGSGYDGRIIKRDILEQPVQAGQDSDAVEAEVIAVSGMRGTIAERLTASKFSAPHYYLSLSADMGTLLAAREDFFDRTGMKISLNSYLIKLSAAALKKHPMVNASWTDGGIRRFKTADIGFAVALDEGLIAPVIKNCGIMGIQEIDDSFKKLAEKAKSNQLKPQEYSGAGFSISNLGSFGIEEFTAIINPPGSAILAVGAIIKTPVVIKGDKGNDVIEVRPIMKMTLSCDHRVIDGAVGAAFMSDLKRMIEEPIAALM